jgi:hypothetical protein
MLMVKSDRQALREREVEAMQTAFAAGQLWLACTHCVPLSAAFKDIRVMPQLRHFPAMPETCGSR